VQRDGPAIPLQHGTTDRVTKQGKDRQLNGGAAAKQRKGCLPRGGGAPVPKHAERESGPAAVQHSGKKAGGGKVRGRRRGEILWRVRKVKWGGEKET